MRVICNTDFFGKKLALVSRGVSLRSTIQILGGILLEAGEEVVRLSAMDMELSIQTSAPAKVEEQGRVVIPARIFNDVVRSLSKEDLTLVYDSSEGVVRLSARENEYRIRAYPAEDFPQLPKFDEAEAFKVGGEALVGTVEKVSRSYSRDETRPVLTGILISFEEARVRMVTTDSYRLSLKETELVTTFDGSREAIIPARAMQEVSRIFSSSDEEQVAQLTHAFFEGVIEHLHKQARGNQEMIQELVDQQQQQQREAAKTLAQETSVEDYMRLLDYMCSYYRLLVASRSKRV